MQKSQEALARSLDLLEQVQELAEGHYITFNEAFPVLKDNIGIVASGLIALTEAMRSE